jgi:hypothetical protein
LIFFASDNGAPIGAHQGVLMDDVLPVDKSGPAWDGSRNDPFLGEKGMLSDGGIRVPFIASWPGTLPSGKIYSEPVITLDMAATANAVAGLPHDPLFDGVNLVPFLTGEKAGAPHEALYWKFWNQAAIRSGDWKFIQAGSDRQLLFNLREDKEENRNLISEFPEKAAALRDQLGDWADQMQPSGLPSEVGNDQEVLWFEHYYDRETEPVIEISADKGVWTDNFNRMDTGPVSDGKEIGPDYLIAAKGGRKGALQIKQQRITGCGKAQLADTVMSYQGLELNPSGFSVSADLKLTKDAARSIGVVFNFQDAENFYKARILENRIQIRRTVNGTESVMFDDHDVSEVGLNRRYRLSVTSHEPYVFTVELTDLDSGNVVWTRTQPDRMKCFRGGYGGLVLSVNHADPLLDNLEIMTVK